MPVGASAAWSRGNTSGYDNSRPVRIGNGAFDQMQHDIWGTARLGVPACKSREQIPRCRGRCSRTVEEAIKHWREPDRGIWDARRPSIWSSKIMCWSRSTGGETGRAAGREELRPAVARSPSIKADILAHGVVDHRGALTQRCRHDALDASLLPSCGCVPAVRRSASATVLAIADVTTEDGLCRATALEETDDGPSGEEGPSRLLVLAGVGVGRDRRDQPGQDLCADCCARHRCTSAAED
jgi:GH15 family glucan-1,4-alpha-glucosidase